MKKFLTVSLVALFAVALLALTACRTEDPPAGGGTVEPPVQNQQETPATPDEPVQPPDAPEGFWPEGLDENGRFIETQTLSVMMWDRHQERLPDIENSGWADYIRETALRDLNLNIVFEIVPRWEWESVTSTLIGASAAPDVSFHFGGLGMTNTFAQMGAILDLEPLLAQYGFLLPNLYDWFDELVYFNQDPTTGEVFAISSRRTDPFTLRQSVFIREDWLNTLDIAPPTTLQEFEDALVAFRDNAELLLGADADMMIPLMMDGDVGWALGALIESFIPDAITEREWFRYDFDARRIMHPTTKEALRVGNRWFNMGLVFSEFAYGEAGDLMPGFIREGFVGAQIANWDMPFRAGGDMQIVSMRENVGPEANFISILPFPNDAGNRVMYTFPAADRQIVLPHTNSNPLASLLFIDLMSRQDVRDFLAFGIEGVHHVVEDNGALRLIPGADQPDNFIFAATNNFDINFVANGFSLPTWEQQINTVALGYAGIEPEAIMAAIDTATSASRVWRNVIVRPIDAQEGMTVPLQEFRDTVLQNALGAPEADFDQVWDTLIEQYMQMGGRAIIEERDRAWVETFGNVDNMPGWTGW